ncbi:MAG: SDR family oxidoreductase [Alphaproteobacteria bacterium]|nr:SDR family oxidoreductase [Alphaproteobacteria bacterium]
MGMLDRKIAIVTGASSGIGAEIARQFASEGAKVALAARRADRLASVAKSIGANALPVQTDVTKEADVLNLFNTCDKTFGTLHILVNCAGFADHTATDELSFDRWNEILATNLTSAFLCSREALKRMKPHKRGRIINIGSISATMPRPNAIGYAATKAALTAMNHSIAMDCRPHGITSSILHPGSTVSELSPNMANRPKTDTMATEDVGRAILLMAALPNETNVLSLTMLPIEQPYLARG